MHSGHESNRYILIIIDHYSRFVKFYQLKTKQAKLIVERLTRYANDFGVPESILLDNALEFTGQEL